MKILQVNKYHYLKGGAEKCYFDTGEIFEKNGHQVVYFSMKHNKNIESKYKKYFIDNIDYGADLSIIKKIILSIKVIYNWQAVASLKKLIKKEKPNIAHLHNIYHQLSPAIIYVLKKNNIPVVMTLHDYKIICPNYKLYNKNKICEKCKNRSYYNCFKDKCIKDSYLKSFLGMIEGYFYNKIFDSYGVVDKFIAPSDFIKNKFIEFGISEGKIKVVKNAIKKQRENVNISQENYLVYFGRLSKEKGVNVLLDTMNNIGSDIGLKIVGDGLEKENLNLKIKKLKLENRVELIGSKSGQVLKDIIEKSKAIIVPSVWYENMPYSILEAMSYGKVVIGSKIGGITELIEDGKNGFLFQAGNSEELSEVISLLDNYDLEKIGQNARKTVESQNLNSYYASIRYIYRKLI